MASIEYERRVQIVKRGRRRAAPDSTAENLENSHENKMFFIAMTVRLATAAQVPFRRETAISLLANAHQES